jgi:hypothetical protein
MYKHVVPYRIMRSRFASGERVPRIVDGAGVVAFDPTIDAVHVLRVLRGLCRDHGSPFSHDLVLTPAIAPGIAFAWFEDHWLPPQCAGS